LSGADILKKEQEALKQKLLNAAQVANHVGSSNPPSQVVENHVPHQAQSQPGGSRSLLAKVGLSVGPETDNKSLASALAVAGVGSAIVGGGYAAMSTRNAQKVLQRHLAKTLQTQLCSPIVIAKLESYINSLDYLLTHFKHKKHYQIEPSVGLPYYHIGLMSISRSAMLTHSSNRSRIFLKDKFFAEIFLTFLLQCWRQISIRMHPYMHAQYPYI